MRSHQYEDYPLRSGTANFGTGFTTISTGTTGFKWVLEDVSIGVDAATEISLQSFDGGGGTTIARGYAGNGVPLLLRGPLVTDLSHGFRINSSAGTNCTITYTYRLVPDAA